MQKPPALQITVQRFEVWRGLLAASSFLVVLTLLAWAVAAPTKWTWLVSCLMLLLSASSLRSLARVPDFSLRWDTQFWFYGPSATRGHEPETGHLTVALDLGFWLLLKFSAHEAGRGRSRWLPVQRRGYASIWHRLRATVYASALIQREERS